MVAALPVGLLHRAPDRWLLAGTGLFGCALIGAAGRLPSFVIGGVMLAATGVVLAFTGVPL